jgi:hypothetical protein
MNLRHYLASAAVTSLILGASVALAASPHRSSVVLDRTGAVIHSLQGVPEGQPRSGVATPTVTRSSQAEGAWIDPEGERHPGTAPSLMPLWVLSSEILLPPIVMDAPPPLALVTIDRMTVSNYWNSYLPYREFRLLGRPETFFLSDQSSWQGGAGSATIPFATFDHAEMFGDTIRYFLTPQPDSLIHAHTDFNSGDHSSQGSLVAAGPLVLDALVGSTTAVMRGYARIRDNEMTWYGEPLFNFFSSIPGSIVPFTNTFTIGSGPWTFETFDHPFDYASAGEVDFANPVSTPPLLDLALRGPRQVPDSSSTQYGAVARYAGEVFRDVRYRASWTVTPGPASVSDGLLEIPPITAPRLDLQLSASFQSGPVVRDAHLTVTCIGELFAPRPDTWPMYQADIGHTGYRPLTLDTGMFLPLWQRSVGSGMALNPVAAGDEMVFCTLIGYFPPIGSQQVFALSAFNGTTLWSTGYGSVFSVNPPSYAYGNVYVQSGNHSNDTYLHGLDAMSGTPVFDSPHSAQWERYYAPTIDRGHVYVDGGSYGGMYKFDAFSGLQYWFNGNLPQYDQWTPALDDSNAYAYLGSYAPGLYVVSRTTGLLRFSLIDPSFEWNGWSMDGTAVVCGNGDVLAIHDGRLMCFNVPTHRLLWQIERGFAGQPSYVGGVIYAIDGGNLVAIDHLSRATLWSWTPPSGSLAGTLIVTDSHVFASTATTTYAVSLSTHASQWSYPAGGALALGNSSLYIATNTGVLHAIKVQDSPVATTLLRFAGEGRADGVRLFWEFGRPGEVAYTELDRAVTEAGPWSPVSAIPTPEGTVMTALDTDVRPGEAYWYRLTAGFPDGSVQRFAPVRVEASANDRIANALRIAGALPARGPVAIHYANATAGHVRMTVMDVAGRRVETLVDAEVEAGPHEVGWSATSARAGVYFVCLEAPDFRGMRRVVLAR